MAVVGGEGGGTGDLLNIKFCLGWRTASFQLQELLLLDVLPVEVSFSNR